MSCLQYQTPSPSAAPQPQGSPNKVGFRIRFERPDPNPRQILQPSDEELVRRAQDGDTRAFSELIERHFPTCLKRALLVLRNRSDAEDEVQNAFVKAFQNLHRFRFEGPFAAWLCRIVQNQCLMLIRDQRETTFVSIDATTDSNARLELINQKPDQEDELGAEQVGSLLRKEISHVPPLMRDVMLLRDIEGLSMPEVAERLGLSVPAAKSRLMRARREMRLRVTKYCGESGPRTLTDKPSHNRAEYTYVG